MAGRRLALGTLCAAVVLGFSVTTFLAAEPAVPLKVLFLGDRGHHQPADRYAQLAPIMAGRGIELTYTEKLSDLNPETLRQYDALLLYANIDSIAPEQAKALLDYVANGGGFVPVHCASFCFRNSAECVALIGAQFLRHGTGEFDTKVVDANHPIMKGLEPFHTWDETYVHTKHNTKDRFVLQVRSDNEGEEPWTWVRTHGKGRVFYTAYGHDARTWGHPGFHDLIERGIRWAVHKGEVFDSRPRVPAGVKPFEYQPAKVPNYVPKARWGTQGEPYNKMQKPVSPEESMKHLVVPPGFEVELFAAEPQIYKPITMAFDPRGRLWIAESIDYPNAKIREGEGRDRITICEDTDHDGRADKFTVFADKLNIPTSLTFANGGVIVLQAPDTLFLKDNDGDDRADERKVLFTGWGIQDTHAGPSNLRYGLDNWIWGIVGYSGFDGTVGGESFSFRQGFFRFKPDGSKLEFLRNTNNNSWGVGFSEDGLVFGSTANGCPSVYLPIPNRYYERVRGWSARVLQNIADSNRFFPITDKVRQVDWHGGFTAGAGHALYTARTFPKQYWNSTAFVSEPTGHLVATFTLHRKGADVASHNAWNLLASDDEWTAPIQAEVGPDGQVWVIDWYNYIVQHNPTPQGFTTGKGNAYETPLRDKVHGRIYRVVAKGGKPSDRKSLDPADARQLVSALKDDNQFWRLHAQRLLVERGKRDVEQVLIQLAGDRSLDPIGLNVGAIHALWTLHGLGALDGSDGAALNAAYGTLAHPSAGVRRTALQVLPASDKATEKILSAGCLNDPDPQVRLAALLALADRPSSQAAAEAILAFLTSDRDSRDRWLADGATAAAAAHDKPFLAAAAAQKFERPANATLLTVMRRVAEHHARGGPAESIGALLVALPDADPKVSQAIVEGLAQGWPKGRPAKLTKESEAALGALLGKLSSEGRGQLASLANRWGLGGFEKYTAEIAASFLATARDESRIDSARIAAARQLVELRPSDAEGPGALLELITPRTSPRLATGLLEAIAQSQSPAVGALLVDHLAAMTPTVRPVALRVLMGRSEWTAALMDGLDQNKLRLTELSLDQKQALASHPNSTIAARAKKLLSQGGGLPDPDRQKVIDQLAPLVLRPANAVEGKKVFVEQCAKCHTHSGEGGKVGPDLTGMAAHPKDELLIHILDPSRSVEGTFVAYTVATTDGRVLTGLLASETRSTVELLDAEAKSNIIQREDIEELLASKKSLMPEGFEKQITVEHLADVLEFLTARGQYLPLDLRPVATAVSTRGLFYASESPTERLIFPDWSPKTFEGVPFQLVDPRGDRAANIVLLYGPQGALPPRMPKSVSLPCNTPAKVIHLLSGVSGWGYPLGEKGSVTMIVRLHYADGTTEDHSLLNGVHFADYVRVVDVPESKLAFRLRGQQVRYLAVKPKRSGTIASIDLVKGDDATAPVVMAVTVETAQ